MQAPTPAGLVSGATDRHAAKLHNFESAFLEFAYLIRRVEAL